MKQRHITIDQLKKMAFDHISYEIEMFEYTGGRLVQGGLTKGETNVMLECFLLHARCLYDFLYPSENRRDDDVFASDYFDDTEKLRNLLPTQLGVSSYLKSRTGKEVVHLTYGRLNVAPSQKQWKVDEVHNQIGEAMVIFFEALSQERRSWFRKVYSK